MIARKIDDDHVVVLAVRGRTDPDLRELGREEVVPVFSAVVSVAHDPVQQDLARVEVLHVDHLAHFRIV